MNEPILNNNNMRAFDAIFENIFGVIFKRLRKEMINNYHNFSAFYEALIICSIRPSYITTTNQLYKSVCFGR